jgi:hypothetical protein
MPKTSNWFLQFFDYEEEESSHNHQQRCKITNFPKIFVTKVYLVNNTGTVVTDAQCDNMIEALNIQLQNFCDSWSIKPAIVVKTDSPPSGSYQIYLTTDTQYTISGAYGYHMAPLNDGTIKAYVSVNVIMAAGTKNGILFPTESTAASVSRVVSHELLEMLVNPGVNKKYEADLSKLTRYPVDEQGNNITSGTFSYNAEVSDAVNQQSFTITTADSTKVQVSDYILPSWFLTNGIAPFNYNNTLLGPLLLSTGGYYSRANSNSPYTINYK